MNVGVLGCGVIAHMYVEGSAGFPSFEVVACADADEELLTWGATLAEALAR